ncbi:Uncharacterised protein [Klebsiella pneumoniae]|nr:Uncharacterised protein [Klebsiella pneumoniae]
MQNAGKNRRHHQIRVGVRPRDAILHAVVLPLAARNTQRDGAVVMPPRSLRRDVHPRLEAAIRVHVRRQQRHRGRHQIDHPGQRAFEQRRVFPIAVHQHVFPFIVQHADVDMHPTAGMLFIRLRHKSGVHLMLLRHQTHETF